MVICEKCGGTLTQVHQCGSCKLYHADCTNCGSSFIMLNDGSIIPAPTEIPLTKESTEPMVWTYPNKSINSTDNGKAADSSG